MTKNIKYTLATTAGMLALPVVVSAQDARGITNLLQTVGDIIQSIIPLIIGLAVLLFIWGVFKYFFFSSEDDKSSGRNFMIWGIVALFVMVSVWGLVKLLQGAIINPSSNTPIPAPIAVPPNATR